MRGPHLLFIPKEQAAVKFLPNWRLSHRGILIVARKFITKTRPNHCKPSLLPSVLEGVAYQVIIAFVIRRNLRFYSHLLARL